MLTKSLSFLLAMIVGVSCFSQQSQEEFPRKHYLEAGVNYQFLNFKSTEVQMSGQGAMLGKDGKSGAPGLFLNYTFVTRPRQSWQIGFSYVYGLSTSESFIIDLPIVNGDSQFSGYDDFGTSFDAYNLIGTYNYHLISNEKHLLSIGLGPGILLWNPQANNILTYHFVDMMQQSTDVNYGQYAINSSSVHWYGSANIKYTIPILPRAGLKFQVLYQHFFNPIYKTENLTLLNGDENESQFSYQKRAWGLQYNLGIEYQIR